jgi:hypothetical protein
MLAYTKNRAYGTAGSDKDAGNGANRRNERLWFSPHCTGQTPFLLSLPPEARNGRRS